MPRPGPRFAAARCALCRCWFTLDHATRANRGPGRRVFCSRICRKRWHRAGERSRVASADRWDGGVTWRAVAQRDGMACYLCFGLTDPGDERGGVAGPRYPSVDHVVPLAVGGWHTLGNARLAHRRCNSRKGCGLPHPTQWAFEPFGAVGGCPTAEWLRRGSGHCDAV